MRKLFSGNVQLPAATLVKIGEWDVTECESVGIDLTNSGAAALTAFEIRGRSHPDADFVPLATSGFTASGWWTRWANAEPSTLAAGASAMVQITVEELSTIQIYAKSTTGSYIKASVAGWENAR